MMTMDEYTRKYIARHLRIDEEEIVSFRFYAEESGGYSEYTQWDFNCNINVTLTSGKERSLYLSEYEVVDFLNGFGNAVGLNS